MDLVSLVIRESYVIHTQTKRLIVVLMLGKNSKIILEYIFVFESPIQTVLFFEPWNVEFLLFCGKKREIL